MVRSPTFIQPTHVGSKAWAAHRSHAACMSLGLLLRTQEPIFSISMPQFSRKFVQELCAFEKVFFRRLRFQKSKQYHVKSTSPFSY